MNEYDKINGNDELKGLLKYFSQNKAETSFASFMAELVKIARKNDRWRGKDYMTYNRWQYYERQNERIAQLEKQLAKAKKSSPSL